MTEVEIIINRAAFKHGLNEADIKNAFITILLDVSIEDSDEKFLIIGFDMNGNAIEVMYNIMEEGKANVFHAMKCRAEFIKLLER